MPEAPLIIRGGHAVAPQEVERVLLAHPAVAEAAVVGVPDPLGDQIVAAAVRLSAPLPSAAAAITGYCRVALAPYQVPTRWLFTPALPRTADGAVRRSVLTAQLAVESWLDRTPPSAGQPGGSELADLVDLFRPRPAIEDLRVPQQVRRSWALEDL
jgi:acyl-coenzyme A synthetase/AMP-(fatty) acid ligase